MPIELDKQISKLLYDYDCVIVPQLGGFVTNYKSSYFSNGLAYPPSKELRFNKNLIKNDGLLAQSIAEDNGISIQEADVSLKQMVEDYLAELNDKKRIELRKVGVLYMDSHRAIQFKPDSSVNYLRSSFGLEPIPLPEKLRTERKTIEEKAVVIPIAKSKEVRNKISEGSGIYRVAAATLIPFIGMSLYLGMTTGFKSPTEVSPADLFPFEWKKDKSVYQERTLRSETADEEDVTAFPEPDGLFQFNFESNEVDSLGVWVDLRPAKEVAKKLENENQATKKYHIIAGCSGEKENADRFVARLKQRGYEAGILDLNKGLHRVKIDSYSEYEIALNDLKKMRDNGIFPNAWLLKKSNS